MLISRFLTYSVSVVLLTFGSRYTAGSACSEASAILASAESRSYFENLGATKPPSFLYHWDLSLHPPLLDLNVLWLSIEGGGECSGSDSCESSGFSLLCWNFFPRFNNRIYPKTILGCFWLCSWIILTIILQWVSVWFWRITIFLFTIILLGCWLIVYRTARIRINRCKSRLLPWCSHTC